MIETISGIKFNGHEFSQTKLLLDSGVKICNHCGYANCFEVMKCSKCRGDIIVILRDKKDEPIRTKLIEIGGKVYHV